MIKQRDGRRNRYQIEAHLPLSEPGTREPAIGEVLALLLGNTGGRDGPPGPAAAGRPGGGPPDRADVITASVVARATSAAGAAPAGPAQTRPEAIFSPAAGDAGQGRGMAGEETLPRHK